MSGNYPKLTFFLSDSKGRNERLVNTNSNTSHLSYKISTNGLHHTFPLYEKIPKPLVGNIQRVYDNMLKSGL